MNIMLLEDEKTWPTQVMKFLNSHHDLFLNWELGNSKRVSSEEYDQALDGLQDILRVDYSLRGYHCTRLTDTEIQNIIAQGMLLPNRDFLESRIRAIEYEGLIDSDISERLIRKNQANHKHRSGMIWFCFFSPYLAGQRGIERLFRSWGGEALYNSHESDPLTGPVLRRIGAPCIIEAHVPISSLAYHGGLDFKVIRRFLVNRGLKTGEELEHEDRAERPIPAQNISRVIRFPESDFIALTKCDEWKPPLLARENDSFN